MRTELSPSSPVSADYCQKQKQNCKCAQTDVRTLNGVYLIHCHVHQPGQKCERQQAQGEGAGLDFHRQGRLRRRALPGRQTGSEPTFKDTISLEWFHFDLNLENWQFPVHLVQLRNLPHPNFTSPVVSATVATNGKHLAGQCPLGILTLPFENLQNVTFVSGLDFDAPALWCNWVIQCKLCNWCTFEQLQGFCLATKSSVSIAHIEPWRKSVRDSIQMNIKKRNLTT